jgi:hypothetical protein
MGQDAQQLERQARRAAAQARAMAAIEAHKLRVRETDSEAELRTLARVVRQMAMRNVTPNPTEVEN